MTGMAVEVGHQALVGIRRRLGFGPGSDDARDDFARGLQFREVCSGLDEGRREVVDLLLQVLGACGGLVLLSLEVPQQVGDVHAASSRSRQGQAGTVSRRAMFAMAAQ